MTCPRCQSTNVASRNYGGTDVHHCWDCDHNWSTDRPNPPRNWSRA